MTPTWLSPASLVRRLQAAGPVRTAAVERVLAAVRVPLAGVAFASVLFDPSAAQRHPAPLVGALGAFAAYSVIVLAALRRRPVTSPWAVTLLHLFDVAWLALVTWLSGGPASPFYALAFFVLLAAGYRWGLPEAVVTSGLAAAILVVQVYVPFSPVPIPFDVALLRVSYLFAGGLLFGYLAEQERGFRLRAAAVARIMSRVRAEAGLVGSVHAVLDDLLAEFRASRGVLALEEEGSERVFLWHAERLRGGRLSVRLREQRHADAQVFLFAVPPGVDAWRVRRPGREGQPLKVLALGPDGAPVAAPPLDPLLATPFTWRRAVGLMSVSGEGWRGRVFVFDPAPAHAGSQLRFLQTVVRQVGPALFNLYLQRRLSSRAGLTDRVRISRALHDGVIQSLIGTEMQLDVLRRESAHALPEPVSRQLGAIQEMLRHEIMDVRDLMQLLRPLEVDADRLPEHLAGLVEGFRHRTGIDARFVSDLDAIDLPPRVCRELAWVAQEALANVRKHANARNVVVSLTGEDGAWHLAVDDDGKGFDFAGVLTQEVLDARRLGPILIKERLRGIGGTMTIRSRPGSGARLDITIPTIPRRDHA